MQVLLYQQQIDDKKHGIKFMKDKVSYRHKTFDTIITKDTRTKLAMDMKNAKLEYPVLLEVSDDMYFTKLETYTRNDGTSGTKTKLVIKDYALIAQGAFESKSLDEIVDEIENAK